MSNTKKKQYGKYNSEVIKKIAVEFGFTPQWVYKAVKGELKSTTGDNVRKKYKELVAAVEKALESTSPLK